MRSWKLAASRPSDSDSDSATCPVAPNQLLTVCRPPVAPKLSQSRSSGKSSPTRGEHSSVSRLSNMGKGWSNFKRRIGKDADHTAHAAGCALRSITRCTVLMLRQPSISQGSPACGCKARRLLLLLASNYGDFGCNWTWAWLYVAGISGYFWKQLSHITTYVAGSAADARRDSQLQTPAAVSQKTSNRRVTIRRQSSFTIQLHTNSTCQGCYPNTKLDHWSVCRG